MNRLIPLLILTASCGNPLADGSYLGDPLLTVAGYMVDQTECLTDINMEPEDCLETYGQGPILIAVLWSELNPSGEAPASPEGLPAITRTQFPARFSLDLFNPPAESALVDASDGRYAWGLVAAFADEDRDGHYTAGVDKLLGASNSAGILYSPDGVTLQRGYVPPGAHVVNLQEDRCENDDEFEFEPEETLVVVTINAGDPGSAFRDTNCDMNKSEWKGLCGNTCVLSFCCP